MQFRPAGVNTETCACRLLGGGWAQVMSQVVYKLGGSHARKYAHVPILRA